jgi:hypothetical protein
MAKIGITLNDVLREFTAQFEYVYDKYFPKYSESGKQIQLNLRENPVTSFNLIEHFPFKNVDEMNEFLHREAALEIFGHADQMHPNLMNQLNNFIMELNDDTEHKIEIVSREAINSIPATYFFLSKTLCRTEQIRFVTKYEDKWNGVDILITANPKVLQSKPQGKVSVKVKTTYNTDVQADYEIETVLDFIKDETLRNKILNTKITTFEELN